MESNSSTAMEISDDSETKMESNPLPDMKTSDDVNGPSGKGLLCDEMYAAVPYSGWRREIFEPEPSPPKVSGALTVGENIVIIRSRAPEHKMNPEESDEQIPQEKAICEFCFKKFTEDENVFKTKCGCKIDLFHDKCRVEGNNKCEFCGQEVQNIPVTILLGPFSIGDKDKKAEGKNIFSLFKRVFGFGS